MDRRIQIYLTNRGEYFQNGVLMGTWVKLPVPEEELESVLESTRNAIRVGKLALIRPVMTLTEGLWVAMIT